MFSCSTKKNLVASEEIIQFKKPDFYNNGTEFLYQTQILLYKNDFSGILAVKPQFEGHRTVFFNEMGMTFFDFGMSKDTFIVNKIFSAFNKKMFTDLLYSDFSKLFFYDLKPEDLKFFIEKKSGKKILLDQKQNIYFYVDTETGIITGFEQKSKFRTILRANFVLDTIGAPQQILLKHKNLKFSLSFIKIH